MSDFEYAAGNDDTCTSCEFHQNNKMMANVRAGNLCVHSENKQSGYYGETFLEITDDFLCNRYIKDNIQELEAPQ